MKQTRAHLLFFPVLVLLFTCSAYSNSKQLPRSSPEAQGVSSAAILAFIEAADQIDAMHSFMLVRHGHVVAEGWWSPYEAQSPHILFSLSKSFTSTAVGLAISEGKLSLNDEVLKFFPEEAPAQPSDNLKQMRVHDLLRMSTGHQAEPSLTNDQPWTKSFLAHSVPHKPGAHFLYNTPATYMLSAIVQNVTGTTVLDYLKPRLFDPLGIENPTWGKSPQGITLGGYGLSVRTEDIARFGQLYLQKGEWQGRRLVPAAWVEAATARQTSNGSNPASDWDQGYGYQFWRCRHGIYRGDGAFGQYCIVMPEQDAVVAITSGVSNMQPVLNLVWDKLLPGIQGKKLPSDRVANDKLTRRLVGLVMRPASGQAESPLAPQVSGKTYLFPKNEREIQSMALEFHPGISVLLVRDRTGENRIECSNGAWKKGHASFLNGLGGRLVEPAIQPVAASGGWTADDTYTVKLALSETPFYITMVFRFDGDQLVFDSQYNVWFGPTKLPQLVGHRAQ